MGFIFYAWTTLALRELQRNSMQGEYLTTITFTWIRSRDAPGVTNLGDSEIYLEL